MDRRFLVLAVSLVGGLMTLAPGWASSEPDSPGVHRVPLDALRPDGSLVSVAFDVLAADDAAARLAAERSLETIAPGTRIVSTPEDAVSAQWLPWQWKWDAAELPVKVAYNPTGAPPGAGPGVITPGLEAWSGVATSSFRFQYAGITENTATVDQFGPDGENVVSWQSLDCTHACVLGVTSKDPVAHEVDMLLNSNPAAADQLGVGSRVDWRTVVLHELGHMAGLEHSCPVPFGPCTAAEADAVMFYQYRGVMRSLAADDIAGISALYPLAANPVPTPGVTPPPTPFPEFPVFVEAGWNLLVLPEVSVSNLALGLPCLRAVYSFEGGEWLSWIRGAPAAIQELSDVGPERGYWLLAVSSCGKDFP
ncbi:MAG: matrixin family metalloprotease [Dehalococcoidia bacterium]